jgi:zinc transport system substrate-binding protein
MTFRVKIQLFAALFAALAGPVAAAPNVVASIKPVHALVAAVMGEAGTPDLLVRGAASPHAYALRPSDARALEGADVVFWTGPGFELFLSEALESLAGKARVVALAEAPGLALLPLREGGAFEPHDSGDDHDHDHDHGHGEADLHFWLDPQNASLTLPLIAAALSAADPANAAVYEANAVAEAGRLDALQAEVAAILAPVREKPFIVFHDAYQYFEARFGLAAAGSLTVSPEAMPGAARIAALRRKVIETGAACVFAEPQFSPAIIGAVIEGTGAKTGTLDPEGATLAEGPGLYADLLLGLARGFAECLGR